MKKLCTSVAILTILAAGSAFAGGPTVMPEQQAGWDGTYIGIDLGGGWGTAKYSFPAHVHPSIFSRTGVAGTFSQSNNGFIGGLQAGRNWQMDNWVFGAETEFDGTTLSATTTNPITGLNGTTTTYKSSFDWLYTFTPRLGYAFDNFLLFGKVGIAVAQEKVQLNSSATQAGVPFSFNQKQDTAGIDAGAGVDYLLNNNWVLGVVYDYLGFGTTSFGGLKNPDDTWPTTFTVNNTVNTVRATAAYKFNA